MLRLTNRKRRQLIFLHVELGQVARSGEDAVGDPVALVVLHVQRLRVDELRRASGRKRRELEKFGIKALVDGNVAN